MSPNPLISTSELEEKRSEAGWLIVDCRFDLADVERGRRDYRAAHITGAVYAHLDEDLSGPKVPGVTGRHPLPDTETAVNIFSGWGITEHVHVVAYDDMGGALAAGRLWWLLRWLGHEKTSVLDGGWQKWQREGRAVSHIIPVRTRAPFIPRLQPEKVSTSLEVEEIRQNPDFKLIDVRAADRYRGQNESIDPVAGHIPGALSAPYVNNMNEDLTFRKADELRQIYKQLLGKTPEERVVLYCGSGVTSTNTILAMMQAGFNEPRLYAGSWSEWITDPIRPVATGGSL